MRLLRAKRRNILAATISVYALQATIGANAAVFINEFHYDNAQTDVGEFVEIAGTAGTDLTGYTLELYNGTNSVRAPYNTVNLSGVLGDDDSGFGFSVIDFPTNGIQNGAPDGLALVDNTGSVLEFLSYEGSFTAVGGAAAGMTSTDIGVRETSSTPIGFSLQRAGTGSQGSDFTFSAPQAATRGAINTGQTFGAGGGGGGGGNEPDFVAIFDIQGAGHVSPEDGNTVQTRGIVTGVTSNGFFLQDAAGDGNDATSDGIFVFTGGGGGVTVGDELVVEGEVSERFGQTQIASSTLTTESTGNELPPAVIIGSAGRSAPTEAIDSDPSTFDPTTDGRDFYESLEGQRVIVPDAQAVSFRNEFSNGNQEIYVVGEGGSGASGFNAETGAITISEGDFNPERLQIDNNGFTNIEETNVGDKVGDIEGHIGFAFGDYAVVSSNDVGVTQPSTNTPEVTKLKTEGDTLTVATYNALLQNNFAAPTQQQIEGVAKQIVDNLLAPGVIGLQEVQVDFANGGAQELIDAIVAAGGPRYELAFVDGNGAFNSTSIQPAFLYDPAVVTLENVELMPNGVPTQNGDAFDGGQRVPLVATFNFQGEEITIVNNHFDSRSGSSSLFGDTQPPVIGGEADRLAQAALVNEFVDSFLSANGADSSVIVLGDLNGFSFEDFMSVLAGEGAEQVLTNLDFLVDDITDRFTFNFDGNAQALDHIFVTDILLSAFDLALDFVHINTLFRDQISDHDPVLLSLSFSDVSEVPIPASGLLMLLGLGALRLFRGRISIKSGTA